MSESSFRANCPIVTISISGPFIDKMLIRLWLIFRRPLDHTITGCIVIGVLDDDDDDGPAHFKLKRPIRGDTRTLFGGSIRSR